MTSSVVAQAGEPAATVGAAVGNTIQVLYPDGSSQRLWLEPDGSWNGESRHGHARHGRWSLRADGAICLKQSQPRTLPLSYCTSVPHSLSVGLRWAASDLLGRPVQMQLLKGVVRTAEAPAPRTFAASLSSE
ncbi:MAG: hypothetical protein JWQ97_1729 [Phenylobacterium sp.]|nr:hypothetical protein [Phenylobacterium sp.]